MNIAYLVADEQYDVRMPHGESGGCVVRCLEKKAILLPAPTSTSPTPTTTTTTTSKYYPT